MTKLTLIIAIVFSGMLMQGQKLIINEIDSFTGKEVKETSYAYFPPDGQSNLGMALKQVGDEYYLKLMVNLEKESLEEGSKLMIKTQNSQVVTLSNRDFAGISEDPEIVFGKNIIDANYLISKEEIDILKTNTVVAVRIYFNDLDYFDTQLKEKHQKKLQKMFNLF